MPPPVRIRYNTKARGGHSHKKRKLNKKTSKKPKAVESEGQVNDSHSEIEVAQHEPQGEVTETRDGNILDPSLSAELIIPKTAVEKERDRKERIMQELMAASSSKWNRKRKQKLEAYITKKLKKEQRLEIFERLSKSQNEVDHLKLQSSADMTSGRGLSHTQLLAIAEDQDVRRAVESRGGRTKRRRRSDGPTAEDMHEASSADSSGSEVDLDQMNAETDHDDEEPWGGIEGDSASETEPLSEPPVPTASNVGSALKRNPDGSLVVPRLAKRGPKPKLGKKAKWNPALAAPDSTSEATSSSASSSGSGDCSTKEDTPEDDSSSSEATRSNSDSEEDASPVAGEKRKRYGGFKAWARKQLSSSKGLPPPVDQQENPSTSALPTEYYTHIPEVLKQKARQTDPTNGYGPLGEELELPNTTLAKHILSQKSSSQKVIRAARSDELQEARLRLPILADEQVIVETILLNPVVVICGETGSGKTTQVPQFLYEAGFGSPGSDNPGMIAITQPRRVAAMSMASRVAHELSLPPTHVSYQIRYDATVSPQTAIKFMTDGVLLRELAADFLLTKYSVIIVDEAHERSINTDILLGVLSRVMKLREEMWQAGKNDVKPLRLVIMSATLRVSDFTENTTLFPTPPPILSVAARQFPVAIHFNRRTTSDYVTEVVKKATKIHCRLPPGGILIFLTGQNEIHAVCRKLETKFGKKVLEEKDNLRKQAFGSKGLDVKLKDWIKGDSKGKLETLVNPAEGPVEAEEVEVDLANDVPIDEGITQAGETDPDALDSDSETGDATSDSGEDDMVIDEDESDVPMHIVPLYSLLSKERQMRVFEKPPQGHRLVVVATNVAETSLTIPGITYVVDAGRVKQRHYDSRSGIESYEVGWVSKASAAQRAGRAGRTGPGHCYRLYSSAFFENHFAQFDEPEILRMPIEGVVLQMKAMHIDAVINFPFPTPPSRAALRKAEQVLTHMGALQSPKGSSSTSSGGQITELGRAMALFPMSPRFSKILVLGRQQGSLPYVIAMVAAMAVGDPFLREDFLSEDTAQADDEADLSSDLVHLKSEALKEKEIRKSKRKAFFQSQLLHSSLGEGRSDMFRLLSVVGAYEFDGGRLKFCEEHFVRPKAMEEIHKLRAQLGNIVRTNFPGSDIGHDPKLPPPDNLKLKVLRQLLTAGLIDRVAARKDVVIKDAATGAKFASCQNVAYRALDIDEDVFIHPSSVIFNQTPPEWVVFHEVVRTGKVYLKGVTVINPSWLPTLGPSMCSFSRPLDLPPSLKKLGTELKIVTPRFGPQSWELPNIKL